MTKTNENKTWLEQYKENYNGKSAEAKEIEEYLKETYKGDKYVPWATMERLTYMQDPNAEFKTIENNTEKEYYTPNQHSLIHTDSFVNSNLVESEDTRNETSALVVSHFVKVSCTFLGKTFIEEYPIQEQDYTPAKIYNQNLVNKALKRALAKVASRATGLGLKLYENKDLQFDEKEEKKPEIKKTNKKAEETKTEETKTEETITTTPVETTSETTEKADTTTKNTNYSADVLELCNLIKNSDTEKMVKVLQNINVAILKQHGFTLNLEDTDVQLCEKLTHFTDVTKFTKAIQNMLG